MFEFIIVKVNTTGTDSLSDRITEVALLHMNSDMKVLNTFQKLVYPDIEIPKIVEEITGITNSLVEGAPDIKTIKDDIISFIGDKPIIGHYLDFDINFLERELDIKLENKKLDTYKMARSVLKYEDVPNFRLNSLCKYFDIDDSDYTRALHNAYLISKLFEKLVPLIAEKKRALDEMNKQIS